MPIITIPSGTNDLPSAAGVKVPSRINGFTLTMSTVNFPTGTTIIEQWASYDGGATFVFKGGMSFTAPWVPTPKHPTSPDLVMTSGWGGDQPSPDHIKARVTNPGTPFQSDFNVTTF